MNTLDESSFCHSRAGGNLATNNQQPTTSKERRESERV